MNSKSFHTFIKSAKLGSARKDAQGDADLAFAYALYKVLREHGVTCFVTEFSTPTKKHRVVQIFASTERLYFDSLGAFDMDLYRKRFDIIDYQLISIINITEEYIKLNDTEKNMFSLYYPRLMNALTWTDLSGAMDCKV